MINGGIVGGYYGRKEPVSFVYLQGRTDTGNPLGSTIGTLTQQADRFMGGGIHHPFISTGQAYAIGFSGAMTNMKTAVIHCRSSSQMLLTKPIATSPQLLIPNAHRTR